MYIGARDALVRGMKSCGSALKVSFEDKKVSSEKCLVKGGIELVMRSYFIKSLFRHFKFYKVNGEYLEISGSVDDIPL